jgi:ABC-type sugar transport system ATPase subunit
MPYGDVTSNLNITLQRNCNRKQRAIRIQSAIEWAGLEKIAGNEAKTLSGGERQRVAIARACLRDPEIFLLDEPMNNMDQRSRIQTKITQQSETTGHGPCYLQP